MQTETNRPLSNYVRTDPPGYTRRTELRFAFDPSLAGRYAVRCDDCGIDIERTDSVGVSAAGGRCAACRH